MAAYAALVSVMHIVEEIQNHPRPVISFDRKQVESLTENVTLLQEFLESYSHDGSEEVDSLEGRIADAAYAAEDVIESYVVDQIHAGSTSSHGESISFVDFCQELQKVIEDLDLIKKEVMEIKNKMGTQGQLRRNSATDGSLRSPPTGQNIMVGFDDVLNEIMYKLIGQQFDGLIIPIVGMGGIGKTTLARNIYLKLLHGKHFDIVTWVTISQNYSAREICLEVLCQGNKERREMFSLNSENELGGMLHKKLWGRRYLIIMDDIWSIEPWEQVKFFFPDCNNGSRIVMTTRVSKLAFQLTGSFGFRMNFLDEDKSWNLLCQTVFGQEDCPLDELEEIGKSIAKNCQGLPLSIVVIGGLLAKSKQTREYWEYIVENLNSIVNLEDNERCLKILYTSYNEMPVHLKPCFLYMGFFAEISETRVSQLIKLWIAEGFLKPNSGKSLEVVAEEYLNELIDRNLILVHKLGSNGKTKFCKIHDLLRDLCSREVEKHKFLCVIRQNNINIPHVINTQRRIGIYQSMSSEEEFSPQVLDALQSASVARSLMLDYKRVSPLLKSSRLLRVFRVDDKRPIMERFRSYDDWNSIGSTLELVNLRYIAHPTLRDGSLPSSVCLLWNLHTLIFTHSVVVAPSEIWKMRQLRHLEFNHISLPDPPVDERENFVLRNLHTLAGIHISHFGEEVVKRIPNVKKLKVLYYSKILGSGLLQCYNNLRHLQKLESLQCEFLSMEPIRLELLQNLIFPHSLKKLTLEDNQLHWEDVMTKIGSLPLLEVLKLKSNSLGPEWETVEGQFRSLKFLRIEWCWDLEYWTTDSTHFPRLEQLDLRLLDKLEEIPSSIGEIPTLQSIELMCCSRSAVYSAKTILEEQLEIGNEGLQVRVIGREPDNELESLAGQNFEVEMWL